MLLLYSFPSKLKCKQSYRRYISNFRKVLSQFRHETNKQRNITSAQLQLLITRTNFERAHYFEIHLYEYIESDEIAFCRTPPMHKPTNEKKRIGPPFGRDSQFHLGLPHQAWLVEREETQRAKRNRGPSRPRRLYCANK